MDTVIPLHGARQDVAGEVRARLARARVTVSQVARITGKSQAYWWRRVTAGETALDVDDLSALAQILDVAVTDFFPETTKSPGPGVTQDRGSAAPPSRLGLESSAKRLWKAVA